MNDEKKIMGTPIEMEIHNVKSSIFEPQGNITVRELAGILKECHLIITDEKLAKLPYDLRKHFIGLKNE